MDGRWSLGQPSRHASGKSTVIGWMLPHVLGCNCPLAGQGLHPLARHRPSSIFALKIPFECCTTHTRPVDLMRSRFFLRPNPMADECPRGRRHLDPSPALPLSFLGINTLLACLSFPGSSLFSSVIFSSLSLLHSQLSVLSSQEPSTPSSTLHNFLPPSSSSITHPTQ